MGGLGEYKGGKAFVITDAKDFINKVKLAIETTNAK